MATDDKVKNCCKSSHEKLVEDLRHCDSPALTHEEKHRCYSHAAWHRGREARRCAGEE